MKKQLTAFLITNCISPTLGFHRREVALEPLTAFAGGFGASSSSTKKGKKTKKKKRKGSSFIADELKNTDASTSGTGRTFTSSTPIENSNEIDNGPELDRFGLPIRTAENFFPPLPHGTELIGVDRGAEEQEQEPSLQVIQSYMKEYVHLNYNIFDECGVEHKQHTNEETAPWKLNLLHKSPPVIEIENFFTPQECLQYMQMTNQEIPQANASKSSSSSSSALKVDSATFSSLALSKRTSTTWFCHYSQVPILLAKARRLLNNLPLEQMEEAQIVRYRTGEEFSWHYDEIPSAQLHNGGQRIATLLVYLNTIEKGGGGGTIFRDLRDPNNNSKELTMQPKQGSALLFFPALLDGTPDDRTLHKGEVAVEEKMIAQMWIHERKYTPVIPEGNSHEAAVDIIRATEKELGYE